jgi:uncharacterized protein (TIGR00251 family)
VETWYFWQDDALVLNVHIQPRAGKDEIAGIFGKRLKIRITAPPVDGKANSHLIDFFADIFQIPRRNVMLLSGETSREKRFKILRPKVLPDLLKDSLPRIQDQK